MRAERVLCLLGLLALSCAQDATVGDLLKVAHVDVTPANGNLIVGGSLQLTATPKTESGIVLTDRTVTWISDNPALATVSATGLVTALDLGGPVEIRATVDNVPGTANVLISAEPVTRVIVAPNQTSVLVGSSAQLVAVAYDASDRAVEGATFTWESSRPATAGVTTTGIVLGVAPGGPALVTARIGAVAGVASITVTAPPPGPPVPTSLGFVQQPSNGTAGQPIDPAVQVEVLDNTGNPVTTSSAQITVRLGNNPGNATLTGTLTVSAVNGIASFTDLRVSQGGTGYTLIASSSGLIDGTSSPFNLTAAPSPPVLTITTQPSPLAVSGQPFIQQPVVRVRNAENNPLVGITVTASIATGGGTLAGTTTAISDPDGFATFTDLAVSGAAGTRTLRFASPGATSVTSNSIVVALPGPTPTSLAFTQQPPAGTAGQALDPEVRVAIRDENGNTMTSSSAPITLRLGNNQGGATLSGTLTVNAVSGVAAFNDLVLDQAGNGYTLVASSSGVPDATSAGFDVAAATTVSPPVLTITTQPSASVSSGQVFPQQPVVLVQSGSGGSVTRGRGYRGDCIRGRNPGWQPDGDLGWKRTSDLHGSRDHRRGGKPHSRL